MSTRFTLLVQSISENLKRHGFDFEKDGKSTWRINPDADFEESVEVRLDDGWLFCRTSLRDAPDECDVWRYARASRFLPGRCKVALGADQRAVWLREDVPAVNGDEGFDTSITCCNAVANLISARAMFYGSKGAEFGSAGELPTISEEHAKVFEDTCKLAGWPFTKRDSGRVVVKLDVPNGSYQAFLETVSETDCRASVRIATYKSLSDLARYAVAVFLLLANDLVRFVRAGMERNGEDVCAFFEVRFFGRPTPVVLDNGFSALSVASRLFGKELEVLGDDGVARRFVGARGLSSHVRCSPSIEEGLSGTR